MISTINPFTFKLTYLSRSGQVELYPDRLIIQKEGSVQTIPLNYLHQLNWRDASKEQYGSIELIWTPTIIQPSFNNFIVFSCEQTKQMQELFKKLSKFCSTNLNQPNDIL